MHLLHIVLYNSTLWTESHFSIKQVTFRSKKSLVNQKSQFSIEQISFNRISHFPIKQFTFRSESIGYSVLKLIFDEKICIYYIVLLDYYSYIVLIGEEKVTFWSKKSLFNRTSRFSIERVTFQWNKFQLESLCQFWENFIFD